MKITGVRTKLFQYTMSRPLGDANLPTGNSRVSTLAIFIDTDEGVTGMAMAQPPARSHIQNMVDNLLVGRDPRGVRGLWKIMVDFVFKGNKRGIVNDAISSIDVALWDLKARLNDEPLWKTLGASTRRVRAYASGIDLCLSDDELRDFYAEMAAQGVNAGKLKVGLDREMDLRRLAIVHEALAASGKKPMLMVDSNEYWSPKQAIRNIRFLEDHYELVWAEEPARRWDYRGLRQVSRGIKAAVATGENLDDISEFMPLIAHEAVDIVQIGSGAGGITGALMIADLAYAYELPVSIMNCPANFMAHVAAVLPNHIMMEVVGGGREVAMSSVDNQIEDGWIILGDAPGHGYVFDDAKLDALAPANLPTSAPAAGWGRRRGAGLVEIGPDEPEALYEE